MSEGLRLDPDAACDNCGQYGAFRFEAETLCGDCYANRGACCSPEFSGRPPECEKTSTRDQANAPRPFTEPDAQ